MKHIKVAILTPSPIIETAIETYISRLALNVCIEMVSMENPMSDIIRINPSILITEPIALSPNDIESLRMETSSRMQVVAVYHTALPSSMVRAYDDTISIYDAEDVINESLSRIISSREEEDASKALSQREKDVVVGIVKGLSNKEIAQEMNVSVNTVMTHRRNIVSKLQIHSPAGLTIYAIVSKLVRLDEIKSTLPI